MTSTRNQTDPTPSYQPTYGNLTNLNTCRVILDAVGKDKLMLIVSDFMDLLQTSSAIYEKNGDYALGIFSSRWCRRLDEASRGLCNTPDNATALTCGKWLYHDSCWDSSRRAMATGGPVDLPCAGGLRIYAIPIQLDDEIIGAINFAYGTPLDNPNNIAEVASKYGISIEELGNLAKQHPICDEVTIELTKRRLKTAAMLIASIVGLSRSREQLRNSEESHRTLVSGIPDLIMRFDNRCRHTFVSENVQDFIDLPSADMIGKTHAELGFSSEMCTFWEEAINKVFSSESPYETEFSIESKRGKSIFNWRLLPERDGEGSLNSVLAIARDITEIKKMQEKIQKQQKLESLAILAGGIAHDFNNLLMGIYGYVDLVCETSVDSVNRRHLGKTLQTIDRARSLTQQLLTFAKGGEPIRQVAPLAQLITQTTEFALSGTQVACRFNIAPNLCLCCFDKNQIAQVIENLVINASQAMPQGGTLEISAANVNVISTENLAPGAYVSIAITDTGVGIPADSLGRIFDPFYTTKSGGSGLGLSTCYSIVKRHGGRIEVASRPGEGSTFTIMLPASSQIAAPKTSTTKTTHTGSGRILIVDDDAMVREVTASMLSTMGYSVIQAANGEDALENIIYPAHRNNETFTAYILDLTIPGGMGGKEIATAIRAINTVTPIFVASGYVDDSVLANPHNYGITASINKPFTRNDLICMLETYLPQTPFAGP